MKKEDYFKYYIQGSDHYLIPKDIFEELFQEMINWKEESKQLQEKLDKNTEIYLNVSKYRSKCEDKIIVLEHILEELKKWLKNDEEKAMWTFETGKCFNCQDILTKIKELEEGVK